MIKIVSAWIVLFLPIFSLGQDFDFDKVIAFDYDGYANKPILQDNKIRWDLVKDSITLNVNQLNKIFGIVSSSESYGNIMGACFDPHLALVYYNNDSIVGDLRICLSCNFARASFDYVKAELDYSEAGFNSEARKEISEFCFELEFSHCKINPESIFERHLKD